MGTLRRKRANLRRVKAGFPNGSRQIAENPMLLRLAFLFSKNFLKILFLSKRYFSFYKRIGLVKISIVEESL